MDIIKYRTKKHVLTYLDDHVSVVICDVIRREIKRYTRRKFQITLQAYK